MYGCLTFLLFGIFFAVVAVLAGVFRLAFGLRRTARRFTDNMKASAGQSETEEKPRQQTTPKQKQKFFGKDEGIYVDFEEVR